MPLFAMLWIVSKDVFSGRALSLIALADADSSFCLRCGLSVGICQISLSKENS